MLVHEALIATSLSVVGSKALIDTWEKASVVV